MKVRRSTTLALGLLTLLFTACATSSTASPTPDSRLTGVWTSRPDKLFVSVDDAGKPQCEVPVGEWYAFYTNGRYVHIARYMTFAVGGVQVEEGSYASTQDALKLTGRTQSFFPDEGSPQEAKYREAVAGDIALVFRTVEKDGVKALLMRASASDPEVLYLLCA